MFIRLHHLFTPILFLCVLPVAALAEDWHVEKTTRQVQYTVDKEHWQHVEAGMMIPNKSWISTGPRGRALLTRGSETITVQAGTLVSIITTGVLTRKTEVVQQKGKITLEIEKRSRPHTYVHTPFLAAVVKGTTFEVTVTTRDATVSVEEGLVQVNSFTGGQQTSVGPGQQATVDSTQQMSVSGAVETPDVRSVSPRAASVPAIGQQTPIGVPGKASEKNGSAQTSKSAPSQSSIGGKGSDQNHGDGNGKGGGKGNGNGDGNGEGGGKANGNGDGNGKGGGKGNGNGDGNGKGGGKGEGKGNDEGKGKGNGAGKGNGKGNEGGKEKGNRGGKEDR